VLKKKVQTRMLFAQLLRRDLGSNNPMACGW
jgi:hypothetical protein